MRKSPLVLEEDKKEEINTENIKKEVDNSPPSNYIAIHLESNGLLDAPKVIYFRDYTMEDALELNTLDEEEQLEAIVRVLNNMVWGNFDCKNLHPKELAQIVYTIHGVFINSKIEKDYYYNLDLPEGRKKGELDHKDNIGTVEISINQIKTKNINKDINGSSIQEKFHEPFGIVDDITKNKIYFRLTRMYDLLFAKKYCDEKYIEELKTFAPYKRKLLRIRTIKDLEERNNELDKLIDEDYDGYKNYQKFMDKYSKEYAKIVQSSVIIGVNDKKFSSIEEKIEAYKQLVSQTLWPFYNETIDTYDFGILEDVTFFSDVLQKNVTRRFQFQFYDFLPDSKQNYSGRYHLQFD